MKRGGDIAAAVLLTLAVAIVVWVRLLPRALPAVADRAASTVRGRIAARIGPGSPAEHQRAVEDWIRAHADEYAAEAAAETERLRTMWQYTDEGGRRRTFLGDYDSYAWLRAARNYLRDGSVCDAPDGGDCRDRFTLAPVGTAMRYGRSLHVAAIVAVHRVATWLDPAYPLAASSYLVPVIVGALGVVPAFAIGRRLAGPLGGFVAGVAGGLHPMLLQRSLGSDNDVWNTALPCAMVWAVVAALQARRPAARIACAALAGALAGLHAATWRGWSFTALVVVVGVVAVLLLHVLRAALRRHRARVRQAASVRNIAVVLLVYCAATALCTYVAGAEQWRWLGSGGEADRPAAATPRDTVAWPSALAQVSELYAPTLAGIVAQSYGDVAFFAGWIGLLLLLLPRHDWRAPHFAVLVGATLLGRYLLTAGLERALVVALLLVPLAAAAAVALSVGDDADVADIDAGVIVATWLLAALVLSYEAMRFVLLLAPPLGIACGVAAGRLHLVLDRQARARWPRHAAAARGLAAAAVSATAILPISVGYATARAYLPALDHAFADTFAELRTTTPPDAIVNTWWDYGYWAEYLAERRVSADGGTLATHVPYWLARAELATSEAEALGLLRMLNCGSDALPFPEGAQGAYGKLLHHGLDGRAAYAAVVQLASLDRAAADRHLTALGLDAAARSDVLAATHCRPPPSYLVLSSQQAAFDGWWQLARWDPGRDGGPSATARELVTADWAPCAAVAGGERRCEIRRADAAGRRVDAVVYSEGAVPGVRLVVVPVGGEAYEAPPDVSMVIGRDGAIEPPDGSAAAAGATAVLLDRDRQRVLLGSPAALTSLYTRLAFLDGAGAEHFHKVSDHTGPWGQRVTAWRIEW